MFEVQLLGRQLVCAGSQKRKENVKGLRVVQVAVAATATEEQDEHIRALYEQFEALLDDYTFRFEHEQ